MRLPLRVPAVNAIRRLDHTCGRWASSTHVLVDVRTAMNLAVLLPVWRRLRDDPRITLTFTAEETVGVGAELETHGLRGALSSRNAAVWKRWDLAMTADAWNHTTLRRCRRRITFFHGVAGKYDLDDPRKLTECGLRHFDRVAFINEDRMQRYLDSDVIRRDQAVLVGFPRIDDLVNGAWSAAPVRASLGLSPSRQTVLYAPTFSTASSLHLAGPQIVAALLDTGSNVIVKLHDRSMVPHPKYTDGIDWPERLAPFESHPRFALARAADAGPFLSASDVLVTDHSTVGFECALVDRPIIVYDAPGLKDAARIAGDKWGLLRSMADVVDSPSCLPEAITTALAHPERLRDARLRARALFAYPGAATERALDVVYELLELDPLSVRSPDSCGGNPVGCPVRA